MSIELGRYYDAENGLELTNRTITLDADRRIHQELLEDKQESTMKLFHQFYEKVHNGNSDIVPLIQDVTDKLVLNSFEKKLKNELWHLENICRQPHFLLNREIEKVNVARAKRVSNRTYGYLSSHTEDWLQKSVVTFKPRKILNEELDEYYDVYENQVVVAFIQRTLRYIKARIDEIDHIVKLLQNKDYLLKNRNDQKGWYKKVDRNLKLIGKVITFDDNDEISGKVVANETKTELLALQTRLKTLMQSIIFYETTPSMVASIMSDPIIKPTNVTMNHKHYRYLRDLWAELSKHRKEKTEEEHILYEQEVIRGVRDYVKSSLYYCAKECLDYQLTGTYNSWVGKHELYCPISLCEDNKSGVLKMTIDNAESFTIVILASQFENGKSLSDNIIVLDYKDSAGQYLTNKRYSGNIIDVSPYDPDSIEWIGKILKSKIIKAMCKKIVETQSFEKMMRDYIHYISADFLQFDKTNFSYRITGFPKEIDSRKVLNNMDSDSEFKDKKFQERQLLKEHMVLLVSDINAKANLLQDSLKCPYCGLQYSEYTNDTLNYLKCGCGFVLDITDAEIIFRNKDPKYEALTEVEWGMDYISIRMKN